MQSIDVASDTELKDVVRLFFAEAFPHIDFGFDGTHYTIVIDGTAFDKVYDFPELSCVAEAKKIKRMHKIALYDALSAFTGRKTPWGALTGVRPTKLFYEALVGGKSFGEAEYIMRSVYRISPERASILARIVKAQEGKLRFPPEYINLYVHIPYCTTRCSYCSFVSFPTDKRSSRTDEYTELLCKEIKSSMEFLKRRGKKILSVYVGGGTPTALNAEQFEKVLSTVAIGGFDGEFTCEAGRPDTVDGEKIDIMKRYGVNRVCVNPQTLNDKTLEAIGRRHTVADFYRVYELAASRGFVINCDLIAGLGDERLADFMRSFDLIKALGPHNITVHSLAKKNGSAIRYVCGENEHAADMVEYALSAAGEYVPYYLYRQKRQVGNLENVGFSLSGFECINNITVMEESVGVMACGAGAISKAVAADDIKRFANMRDIGLYIERFEQKTDEKIKFFEDFFAKYRAE